MLSVKQGSIKYHFFFGRTRPGIEPRSPGQLANILLIRPISIGVMSRVFTNGPGDRGSICVVVMLFDDTGIKNVV